MEQQGLLLLLFCVHHVTTYHLASDLYQILSDEMIFSYLYQYSSTFSHHLHLGQPPIDN